MYIYIYIYIYIYRPSREAHLREQASEATLGGPSEAATRGEGPLGGKASEASLRRAISVSLQSGSTDWESGTTSCLLPSTA